MKGGFYKEYSEEDFEEFVSPHVKGIGDCCPCAFRMLNIINDDDFKSMTKNFKERGNWYKADMENFFRKNMMILNLVGLQQILEKLLHY